MTLRSGKTCRPYARKVRVLAMETRLDRKMEMVNVAVSPVVPNADVDKHNPIGKIPALSVKGMDLFDSPVICEYLDSLHKGRKLLPRKGRERWVALRLQAMADGLLDAAILTRYEGALRPKDKRWPDWIKGQTKKIEGVLAQLEAEAKSLKGKPTIGTISVACALGYLDYRFAAMDWRAKHPKLAKLRRQAERRLVEHENFRASHKTAGDGEHLLLTTGKEAGALVAARLERSKALEQRFDAPRRVVGAARIGAEAKIVDDAEVGKDLPALRSQGPGVGDGDQARPQDGDSERRGLAGRAQRRRRQAQSHRQDPRALGQGHGPLRFAGDLRVPR